MSSQHKHPPISFRPPEADRARLLQYVTDSGEKVNAVLARALAEYLDRREAGPPPEGITHAMEMDTRRQLPELRQEMAPAPDPPGAKLPMNDDLIAFVAARLDEGGLPPRVIEALRAIIKQYECAISAPESVVSFIRGQDDGYRQACRDALRDLAAVWSDQADYRPERKP